MATRQERILVVESDPEIRDVMARQVLESLGFSVQAVGSASEAIQQSLTYSPELIITSLSLPDLSGKDLLVALNSQGLEIPAILIIEADEATDAIQAHHLGASDFLIRPVRGAELASVVERTIKQVRARREREDLADQLQETNRKLQRRVRELTTIFAIGKAVTSITDQDALFERIVEGAVYVTEADRGWLLIFDEKENAFKLRAYHNLPESEQARLNQPWEDGISSLVALSGKALSIHGEPLQRFRIWKLGRSALVVPLQPQNQTIGLLTVLRKEARPFSSGSQTMLEAVADYASISLVNARLFQAVEARARSLQAAVEKAQQSEQTKEAVIRRLRAEIQQPLTALGDSLKQLENGQLGSLNERQRATVQAACSDLERVSRLTNALSTGELEASAAEFSSIDLTELARDALSKFQNLARRDGIALRTEMPPESVWALAHPGQIGLVLEGLLANALKFSRQGGQVTLQIADTEDQMIRISVQDTGSGIATDRLPNLFENDLPRGNGPEERYRGLGIRLAQIREIVGQHGGRIWVESKRTEGSTFHFTLRRAS